MRCYTTPSFLTVRETTELSIKPSAEVTSAIIVVRNPEHVKAGARPGGLGRRKKRKKESIIMSRVYVPYPPVSELLISSVPSLGHAIVSAVRTLNNTYTCKK